MDRRNPALELFPGIVQSDIVTDDASPSPPTPPDRVALQKAARDVVFDAMKEWEAASHRRGFDEGWKACNDHWLKLLNEATQKTQAGALTTTTEAAQVAALDFENDVRGGHAKASDAVMSIIRDRPGLRGIEIVKAAADVGQAIHERTVRTALHRMKRDGLIKNLEGRWFATGRDPDGPNSGDGGENDD